MRILISAYACEPGKGSEPEVGLQVMLAAASEHEVWVITKDNNLPSLRDFLTDHPSRENIHLIGLDVEGLTNRFKKKGGLVTLHAYHHLWQRRLADVARELDNQVGFDVVHHATFATYWARVGAAAVGKPLVWGPVGGGVSTPIGLLGAMGWKGALGDIARAAFRPPIAALNRARRVADQAAVVLIQNVETARSLGDPPHGVILPNGLVGARSVGSQVGSPTRSNVVSAGRLVGWKGATLAVRAMSHVGDGVELDIYGEGPDRARIEKLVAEHGLSGRVHLRGLVPRAELLSAVAGARVFLHPAVHDESPLSVAEALSLGTPVVCLDRGGPPELVKRWPDVPARVVQPSTVSKTVGRLATAIEDVIDQRAAPDPTPGDQFGQEILAAYERAKASGVPSLP